MGFYVADKVIELMKMNDIKIKNSSILILGITFKENCPDVRNTKVVDIVFRLNELGVRTTIYDPWANPIEVKQEFGLISYNNLIEDKYDSIILAVSHNQFYNLDYQKLKSNKAIIYDVKGFLGDISDAKL